MTSVDEDELRLWTDLLGRMASGEADAFDEYYERSEEWILDLPTSRSHGSEQQQPAGLPEALELANKES